LEDENIMINQEIQLTDSNYKAIVDKINENSKFYREKSYATSARLINENHTKESHLKDKETLMKLYNRFTSENVHHSRTLEKNKLFKEDKDEKNRVFREKTIERFNEIEKSVVQSLLDYQGLFYKYENNSRKSQLDHDNAELIFQINRLERDSALAKAKIIELENNQIRSKQYLHGEETVKRGFDIEHKKLSEELDGLGNFTDELLKQKVKEKEKTETVLLSNTITNNERKWNLLLSRYKEEEQLAKDLLEERVVLNQKLIALGQDIENQAGLESTHKYNLIELKNAVLETQIQIEENKAELTNITTENHKLTGANAKFEYDIMDLKFKLDEFKQKVELNAILKDVDVEELKLLTQNNALVNSSISNLVSKWDQAYCRLQDLEKSKEF
jgi:hypothetical protein